MTADLKLTPILIAKFLLTIVSILLIANLVSVYLKFIMNLNYGFIGTFYFNREFNIPTFYSFLTLAFCAILLWLTGNLKVEKAKNQSGFWKFLSFIFVFLALDEFVGIHENFTNESQVLLGDFKADGYLHFAWVFPYVIIFGLIFLFLIKAFLRLPLKTRILFSVAGFVFVFGAVGMEMIGGRYVFKEGYVAMTDLNYGLLVTVEELFEMIGIIIFIYALLTYYVDQVTDRSIALTIRIKPSPGYERMIVKNPFVTQVTQRNTL